MLDHTSPQHRWGPGTPHPAIVLRMLIPVDDPAPVVPAVEADAEGEDDSWWIPPVYRCQVLLLDEYSSACVDPDPNYVELVREDPMVGSQWDDLPLDESDDEMWAELGVHAHQHID